MQWRNWRKITSLWRFDLDAKSGPLEAGDFGENGDLVEIGDFGKNRQRAGDSSDFDQPTSTFICYPTCMLVFFLFIYAFKPIKVYINMHRTV